MRRAVLPGLLVVLALLPLAASAQDRVGDRPNILIILADDLGYSDLGAYGGEIMTPRLDALASSGLMFTRFYANASCSPTRAMLLSGTDNHVAGVGLMHEFRARAPAGTKIPVTHEGVLSNGVASLSEIFQTAGYRTIMAGKWHLGYQPGQFPGDRGFDHSFALLEGGASHFKQGVMAGLQGWDTTWLLDGEPAELPDDFYSSRFLTDYLIEQIGDRDDAPFLAYAAYTAPHWPVQAPAEDIDRYRGRYDAGYAAIMAERLARQYELGLTRVDSPADPALERVTLWPELTADERAMAAREMEAYAGMVTALDREIGRLIDHLQAVDQYRNTIIVFLSDNGAEGFERTSPAFLAQFDLSLDNVGQRNSFVEYGPGWAQVSSTPNRMWKLTGFEGGNRVPAFVHYPAEIATGRTDAFATVMDVLPTLLDLTGVAHPGDRFQGRVVAPMQGVSLAPLLAGDADSVHGDDFAVGFEVNAQASLHTRDWKIVYSGAFTNSRWQLFDMSTPAGERSDVAASNPKRLASMLELWRAYAQSNGVLVSDDAARVPRLPY